MDGGEEGGEEMKDTSVVFFFFSCEYTTEKEEVRVGCVLGCVWVLEGGQRAGISRNHGQWAHPKDGVS